MKSFKISIILPVYNVEKYLPPCLDSLVGQTLDEVEIVAVNDGSTDGSLRILEQYREQYPEKLFVYTTPNQGVSHARNFGFRKSHGEYVWFVDSDDFIERNACERLYLTASANGNDLVLFSYFNVDAVTGEKSPFPCGHYNQNFSFREKPYEMSILSPFPWIKLIRHDLFEGLAFPEGIRFEDLPIAYLLAAKAKHVGVVRECLYNYRKNAGFLAGLTPATADIKKAIVYLNEQMEALGLRQTYQSELDFIAIRHFFFRFWKLLTNYETGKKELKLSLIQELWDYIEQNIPDWRENHYVKYTLPEHLHRMLYLYGDRQELVAFVEACDGKTEAEQKAWIKAYKKIKESGTAAAKSPDSPPYEEALAQAGPLVADAPLPWYFHKAPGQEFTLLCTNSLYPTTFENSRNSCADIGLWQHSMLTADLLVFPDEITRRIYMRETMLEGICRTKERISEDIFSAEDFNRRKNPQQSIWSLESDDSREILHKSDTPSFSRRILCCPVMLGMGRKQAVQARRSFINALYQLDWELMDGQNLYLATAKEDDIDCGEFRHIQPLPANLPLTEAARACDVFLSDYHPLMLALARHQKPVVRFFPGGVSYKEDAGLEEALKELAVPTCTDVPALVQLLNNPVSGTNTFFQKTVQEKIEASSAPPQKPHVLLYAEGKLSKNRIQEIGDFLRRHSDKEFWLAYSDFANPKAEKQLSALAGACHVLPLKLDPQKSFSGKLTSALSRRLPFASPALYAASLPVGKKHFSRYFGSAAFDAICLCTQDGIQTLSGQV